MRGDGSLHCYRTREEVQNFFKVVADGYYNEGGRSGGYRDLTIEPIDSRSVLASITWQMARTDGKRLRDWRNSYNLVHLDGRWQILLSTFHIE